MQLYLRRLTIGPVGQSRGRYKQLNQSAVLHFLAVGITIKYIKIIKIERHQLGDGCTILFISIEQRWTLVHMCQLQNAQVPNFLGVKKVCYLVIFVGQVLSRHAN